MEQQPRHIHPISGRLLQSHLISAISAGVIVNVLYETGQKYIQHPEYLKLETGVHGAKNACIFSAFICDRLLNKKRLN